MKRMKKLVCLVLCLALAVSITACGGEEEASGDGGGGESGEVNVYVGIEEPLTGANASLGTAEYNAIEMCIEMINEQGGVAGMEKLRDLRSSMLYDTLDNSKLFKCHAEKGSRSGMNVTFRTGSEELDAKFVSEATAAGFVNLKGHRKVGGMRASIYNAMPVEGVEKLCDFIKEFDQNN